MSDLNCNVKMTADNTKLDLSINDRENHVAFQLCIDEVTVVVAF